MEHEALLNINLRVAVPEERRHAAHFHILQVLRWARGEISFFSVPPDVPLDRGGDDPILNGTLAEIELRVLRDRLVTMRPDASYKAIAETLGVTEKTLWEKRKRLGLP